VSEEHEHHYVPTLNGTVMRCSACGARYEIDELAALTKLDQAEIVDLVPADAEDDEETW
jgi:hypothetical protein